MSKLSQNNDYPLIVYLVAFINKKFSKNEIKDIRDLLNKILESEDE